MKKQKRNNIKFKTPKRYRLSLFNENSLNQIWTIKMGRKSLLLLIVVTALALFSAGIILISLTPLRTFLPGYLSGSERRELLQVDSRVDSLCYKLEISNNYLNNVRGIITGELSVDSLLVSPQTEILSDSASVARDTIELKGKSQAEIDFVKKYSERENFVLEDRHKLLAEAPLFVPPVKNAMIEPGKTATTVNIEPKENVTGVYAINRGFVVDQYMSADGRFVVIIQHLDGYLSRYGGLSRIYTRIGASVDADSRIGQYTKDSKSPFEFELRRDGQELPPLDYIPF